MKNLRISHLRVIEAVATHQSFSRAAEDVSLSLAAASSAVGEIERQIGIALFERTTRSVRLTPVGREVIPRIRSLLRSHDELIEQLVNEAAERRGRVVLGCLTLLGVRFIPRALALVRKRYPQVRVEVRDNAAPGVYEDVQSGRTDLALASEYRVWPALRFSPLASDEFVLVCSRTHALARKRSVKLAATTQHTFVAVSRETGVRYLLERHLGPLERLWTIGYEVSQLPAAIGLVAEGLGISIVPALALPPGALEAVRVLRIEDALPLRQIGLLRRADRPLTAAGLAVAQALEEVLLSERQRSVGRARCPPEAR